jgi:hypothetical protein
MKEVMGTSIQYPMLSLSHTHQLPGVVIDDVREHGSPGVGVLYHQQ